MKSRLIRALKILLKKLGVGITSYENLERLRSLENSNTDLGFIKALGPKHYLPLLELLDKSKSQLRQDLFVLSEVQYKHGGFFVEFGATDGISLSNTHLLEKEFEWQGILAEPAKVWQSKLARNRPASAIENRCVWKDSHSVLKFNETDVPELSTINSFSDKDGHKESRLGGDQYDVRTISLLDLLEKFNAPQHIDYLSIDTEGSEYEILKAFDFNKYSFGVITVEHNYTKQREEIYSLLTGFGYQRKFEDISRFDDWYVR
jgi:FkbM family methyltransferase